MEQEYYTDMIYLASGISELLSQANVQHSVEYRHLFSNNNMKPADIYIPNWSHDGKNAALDIGITSVANNSIISQSQSKLLTAAASFYNHKNNKYNKYINDNNININNIGYIPIIIEDYGGFHKETVNHIKKIAILRAANMNIDKSQSINYCFTKISALLQKANAISLLNHYSIYNGFKYK